MGRAALAAVGSRPQVLRTAGGVPDQTESTLVSASYTVTADGVTTDAVTYTAENGAGAVMPNKTVTFTVERVFLSASLSDVTATPGTIANDGIEASDVTVQVKDTDGYNAPGIGFAQAVLAVTGTGNTVTQPAARTDAQGRTAGSFVSTGVATKTCSYTVSGLAITDTASVVVEGSPSGAFPNEPGGYTIVDEWNDEATVAGPLTLDGSPYISVTNTEMGTMVFDGATNLNASNGATPWATNGIATGMMAKFSSTASNNTYYALTAVSGQNATTRTANTSETDSSYTLVSGWGDKTRVTSGYTGSPTYGGSAVVRTYYPGGVHGGHDAGRLQMTVTGTPNGLYAAVEVFFPNDYPVSTSSGGNKHLIVTFSGGSRFFINFDDGAAAGHLGIYIGSAPLEDSTTDYVLGAWTLWELWLVKPTGPATSDGQLRLYADGVNILTRTNLSIAGGTFPSGNYTLVYWDGSNNGNHTADHPTGQRYIGVDGGTENQDAIHYMAVLYASTA